MFVRRYRTLTLAVALVTAVATVPAAETTDVTSPKQFFGFNIGDDYQLANYTQLAEYWQKLDKESNRMKVVEIGKTAEGRPQLMAIVTVAREPQEARSLQGDRAAACARAEGLTDEQARALAKEGKAVVWIDGGLHATEVARRAPADRDRSTRWSAATDAETLPVPGRRDHPVRARESRRHGAGVELVHARDGSDAAIAAPACRGSTTSTPATTTTATSTCRTWPRPRT